RSHSSLFSFPTRRSSDLRDFRLGSLEKLLVSAVHEFGDFATDQITGIREYLHAIIAIFLNRRRAIVFLEEHTALHTGRFDQIETDRKSTRLNSSHLVISY